MLTPQDPIRFNGYRIQVLPSGWGAFTSPNDPYHVPAIVAPHYCSICATIKNGASRDGEANCEHKSLLRFAIACLNDADDADYYRGLSDLRRAAAVGR